MLNAFFAATPKDGAILVEWETVSGIRTLGFVLYRSEVTDGPLVRLNKDIIPAQLLGSLAGALYGWLDETVAPAGGIMFGLFAWGSVVWVVHVLGLSQKVKDLVAPFAIGSCLGRAGTTWPGVIRGFRDNAQSRERA